MNQEIFKGSLKDRFMEIYTKGFSFDKLYIEISENDKNTGKRARNSKAYLSMGEFLVFRQKVLNKDIFEILDKFEELEKDSSIPEYRKKASALLYIQGGGKENGKGLRSRILRVRKAKKGGEYACVFVLEECEGRKADNSNLIIPTGKDKSKCEFPVTYDQLIEIVEMVYAKYIGFQAAKFNHLTKEELYCDKDFKAEKDRQNGYK